MDIGSVTSYVSTVPADWIILGAVALLLTIDAIRVGVGRISSLGIGMLLALLASTSLTNAAFLGSLSRTFSTPVLQALQFGLILVLMFIFVRRLTIDYSEMGGQPIQAIFAGVAVAILLIVTWLQVPALSSVWNFNGQIQTIFGEAYRFWWIIGSFAALAFERNV
ncbi:MAG: hypothetical protein G01um10148_835 [Parcubacteria group bacterium Gr01-1014_8]|nr:MAG: hypothetical protein G01um10148_835 [Parcubacteria group bacterium Gr01-1014_8]